MNEFFTEYPPVIQHPHSSPGDKQGQLVDWEAADDSLQVDRTVTDVTWAVPGKTTCLKVYLYEKGDDCCYRI